MAKKPSRPVVKPTTSTGYSSGVVIGPASKTSYKQGATSGPLSASFTEYKNTLNQLGANTPGARAAVSDYVNSPTFRQAAPNAGAPMNLYSAGSTGGSKKKGGGGGGGRRKGGGGGGGANVHAQAQMDYLTGLLSGSNYTAPRNNAAYDADQQLRTRINDATTQDQQAATGAYNNLDTYLNANQTNPYANVQLQHAAVAPSYNPYLESQGIAGSAPIATNPNDGGYGAFQNVLSLLSANQQANNASGLRQSQEARTYAGQQIGGMNNAYLANVDTRDAQLAATQQQAQAALDAEKRQGLAQLAALIAQGAKAPNLAALGLG